MHLVVVTELHGTHEDALRGLVPVVGAIAYEVRARLAQTLPTIIYHSRDEIDAERVRCGIEQLGHGVVRFDADALRHAAPVNVRRFAWDAEAAYAGDSGALHLPWKAVGAVILIELKRDLQREHTETIPDVRAWRGVRLTRPNAHLVSTVDRVAHVSPRERIALLYRVAGNDPEPQAPWLLREYTLQAGTLGTQMKATHRENFLAFVSVIRAHAERAHFDDRFTRTPFVAQPVYLPANRNERASPELEDEVLVKAATLSQWLQRQGGAPYR